MRGSGCRRGGGKWGRKGERSREEKHGASRELKFGMMKMSCRIVLVGARKEWRGGSQSGGAAHDNGGASMVGEKIVEKLCL